MYRSIRCLAVACCLASLPTLASAAVYDDFSTATAGAYPLSLPTGASFIEAAEANTTVLGSSRFVTISAANFQAYSGPVAPAVTVSGGRLNYTAPSNFPGLISSTYGFATTPTFNLTEGGATAFVVDVTALTIPAGGSAQLQFAVVNPVRGTDELRSFDITAPGIYTYDFSNFATETDFTNVNWFNFRLRVSAGGTFSVGSFGNNVAVPEPTSLTTLALPAIALLRRRRR